MEFWCFKEEFNDEILDPTKFSDSYMPHWTTPEQSLAHYDVTDGILSLRIDKKRRDLGGHLMISKKYQSSRRVCAMECTNSGIPAQSQTITVRLLILKQKYGYFELRCHVPNDGGLHSAWWIDWLGGKKQMKLLR